MPDLYPCPRPGRRQIGHCWYRIIATRPCDCGCGSIIQVTTKNQTQRFLNREHIPAEFKTLRGRKGRVNGAKRRLENVFGRLLNRAIEGPKVSRVDLLLLLHEAYRMGYTARNNALWRAKKRAAA